MGRKCFAAYGFHGRYDSPLYTSICHGVQDMAGNLDSSVLYQVSKSAHDQMRSYRMLKKGIPKGLTQRHTVPCVSANF
jgi:hypothetical protein